MYNCFLDELTVLPLHKSDHKLFAKSGTYKKMFCIHAINMNNCVYIVTVSI